MLALSRPDPSRARGRRLGIGLALTLIVLAAAWLRVSGHDWDQDQHLNADDYYVAKFAARLRLPADTRLLLDPQSSPLNPRAGNAFYVYGTLPLYLAKGTAVLAAQLTGDQSFIRLDGVLQTGRVLAGLFDTLTLLLVFAVGRQLWGAPAGLVAAAFYAGAVLPIQSGHFFICDPFMATFMLATLLASLLGYQTWRPGLLLLAGLAAGLALACKLSAAPVLALPLLATAGYVLRNAPGGAGADAAGPEPRGSGLAMFRRFCGWGTLALGAAFLGLLIGDPFAVLDARSYIGVLAQQADIQNGGIDQWFTRKYVGTWPVLYLWGQLILLGVGSLVGVAGTAGAVVVAIRVWRRRRLDETLLILGAGIYFASIAFVEIKWVRYLIPLVPYVCLFATAGGFALAARTRIAGAALLGVLLVSAALGGLAVSAIFHTDQTQIQASRWIYAHIPPGRRIGVEKTTIALPLPLPGHAPEQYPLVLMDPLADQSSAVAAATLRAQLAQADYLVLDTTQAALTVPRLPWRYPVQIRYYDLLFHGQLGFTPVYTATSYPTVLGLAIPDDGGLVDASFMDSSHPPIHLFAKTRALGAAEWDALFAAAVSRPSVATRHAP